MTHIPLLSIIAAACLLPACNREEEASRQAEPKPIILGPEDVASAKAGRVVTGPLVSGELEARQQATVRAQIGGSMIEVRARAGQPVERGEILARIQALAEREAVGSAEAAVRTAETELAVAQRDEERTAVLVKAGALAQRDLEQARAVVASASAAVAEAKARLAAAREQLAEAMVRAPITGIVSEAAVNTGDVVSVGAQLFTIIDPYTMELRASVPAENLSNLRVGTPVLFTVQGYPNNTFHGRISRIVPAADPATKQVNVYASIPNNAGILISGLYAEGRIAIGGDKGIVLPADAVRTLGNSNYVLKVSDGRIVRQQVSLGARDERTGQIQILSGLQPGDLVLRGAATEIREGAMVEVRG
jgi:RND family efflux transporter MFP subunit